MKISEGIEYMPQLNKEVNTIQFNYFINDELINVKYKISYRYKFQIFLHQAASPAIKGARPPRRDRCRARASCPCSPDENRGRQASPFVRDKRHLYPTVRANPRP